jgi:autotransporter adhesin
VAAGAISATSTQAVNGSELYATDQAVTVLGSAVSSLGSGSGGSTSAALALQVASNTAAVAALSSEVSSGLKGLVQQQGGAPGAGAVTVGAQTGGTSASIAGTSGARVLGGVAAGVASTDAVDVGQLQAALGGATANTVQYDNSSHSSVTLGGTGAIAPVALNNVAAGALSATSTAAVNGSQLYAANTNITNLQNGAAGPFQVYQSGTVTAPVASGLESTAGGDGAIATGGASTAIGYRATASGVNSVALGANSSDGGQSNVVSVGSPGNERRITNVAPGVAGTDAANINQLNAVSNYAASLNNALNIRLSQAVAGGAALSSIPTSVIADKGMFGMAYGQYGDSFAVGIGASKVFNDRFNTTFRVGVTFSVDGGPVTSGAGIGWHF